MFGRIRVESPEQIEEHLDQVDRLERQAPLDLTGGVWAFPDTVHQELRYFRLHTALQGPAQKLRAGSRHMVQDISFLHPNPQHITGVTVDAYELSPAKLFTTFAIETSGSGFTLGEDQFKIVAARGVWEYLSGVRTDADIEAVSAYVATRETEDTQLRAYLQENIRG